MSYDSKNDYFCGRESSTKRGVEEHRKNNNDKKEREDTVKDKRWQTRVMLKQKLHNNLL